jgi:hypothetical protein
MARKKKEEQVTEEVAETPVEQPAPVRHIDFKWLSVDLLVPNAWNVNAQDDATFNLLQDEIAEVGLIDPIEVVPMSDGNFLIIGGEHRWRAAKNLNHEEVPCILLTDAKWQETDLQKFVSMRLNVIHGKIDAEKFAKLYTEMAEKYGADSIQRLMGYTDSRGFQKLVGQVKKGLKEALPKEMQEELEQATKDVKSMKDLENIIQDLFQKYGDTLNQSYMIFTYGKQQHIYIAMGATLRAAMTKLMTYCSITRKDINEVVAPLIQEGVKALNDDLERLQREKTTQPKVVKDDW